MIAFAIWALGKLGLAESLAKKLAPLAVAIAFACALGAFWAIYDHFNDKAAIEQDRLESNVEQLEGQVAADAAATGWRTVDAQGIREQEEAYAEAIESPRPGDSSDPRIRLACERLRRDGQNTAHFPACGGR